MKKLLALLVSVLMAVTLALPAMAEEPTDGSITINNAERNKYYVLVKAFDAQTANGSVSYRIKEGTKLYTLIKNNTSSPSGIACPFEIHPDDTVAGYDVVVHKADPNHTEFGRGWLKETYDMTNGWKGDVSEKEAQCTSGDSVVFSNLTYGYYMVFPKDTKDGNKASVVTAAPNATINDKNPRTPSDPTKTADKTNVSIGDVVTYTAGFRTTNYYTGDNMVTEQIQNYVIHDTATSLKYKSLKSVKLYSTKNANGTYSGLLVEAVPHDNYKWNEKLNSYTMNVPWVDAQGNSLYQSPAYLVFEYDMYVTEAIKSTNTATNKFEPYFQLDPESDPVPIDNPPTDTIYTSGLSLTKVSGQSKLTGATFKLSRVADGKEEFYKLVEKTSETTGEKYTVIEWQSTKEAGAEVEAKNSNTIQTFAGLSAGTYKLYEIKAPQGYVAPTQPWTIEITFNGVDAKDAEQNPLPVFSGKISPTPGTAATSDMNLATGKLYFATNIVNTNADPLPQTGAKGVTMMLTFGGIIFVGTMLLLVTKKRMYNQG